MTNFCKEAFIDEYALLTSEHKVTKIALCLLLTIGMVLGLGISILVFTSPAKKGGFPCQRLSPQSLPLAKSGIGGYTSLFSSNAGDLKAIPSSMIFGVETSVRVVGTGWISLSEKHLYELFFDGEKKLQQVQDFGGSNQPDMTFTVPGTTAKGCHTITVLQVVERIGTKSPETFAFRIIEFLVTDVSRKQ